MTYRSTKIPCPEPDCGKLISYRHMAAHLRAVHDIAPKDDEKLVAFVKTFAAELAATREYYRRRSS